MDYSVIIPHRDSVLRLPKLFSTILKKKEIEILVIDNSPIPLTKAEIEGSYDYDLLYSAPSRGAGGARNVGIEAATGKWLIFADADDFFAPNAFETFYKEFDNEADVIYFCAQGIYSDTGEPSSRGDLYTGLVQGFLDGSRSEMDLRMGFSVPWAKMVRRDFVMKHGFRFDEVVASNDVFFSMLIGYNARSIQARDEVVYYVTVSKGSLMHRRDADAINSRLLVNLRYNKFVREHNLGGYQKSVMHFIFLLCPFGWRTMKEALRKIKEYHQNPFIGISRWGKTVWRILYERKKKKYLTS